MSTPDFEVHRAIVHYSDPVSGDAQVRIPSLLGVDQVVSIPTIGLTNTDGFWNVPSIGASVFVAVSDDRTQFLWLTAVGISGSGGDDPSNEPIGHEDRTASYIAFDNGTRTFSIQPANGSYVVWCVGLRYEKANLESIQIPDTTGLYYISFNAQGQLQYSEEFFVWDQDCPTAYVYWNSTTQRAEFFADERHGITMDWQTHEYLHRTRGAAYANGFDASNFDTSTQDGNTDAQAKLDIDNGTFFDEDLQVDVRHSLAPAQNTWEQQLQGPARIPVFYKIGTGWKYDAPTDFPVKQGTTHPMYNRTSDWSVQELGANSYGIQWIVATNQLNYPILSIMGQTQYANVGQAEAASWADMDLDGLPIVEIRVLYKIIFRATGSNTPGCYFEQIDDYRNALSSATSTAAAVVDHGNLTGLADDDHPQYAFRNTSPTITLAGDATGSVTLTDLGSGTLTLAVVNDSHTHDGRYYTEAEVDSLLSGKSDTSHNHTYNVNNAWLRDNGDNANVKLYGNSRQMAFRTDGTSEYASGIGGYPFAWMYGGDAASDRRMLLNTSGQLWLSNYGWLHDKFSDVSHSHSYLSTSGGTLTGELVISNTAPQMKFNDTTAGADDFWIHVNSNRFYVLADRDDNGAWDGAYPLELRADTNIGYVFGSQISTVGHTHAYASTSHTHAYASTSHTHSYLPTSGGSLSGALSPSSDNTYDLGTNSRRWRFLYCSQGVRFNNTSGQVASIAMAGNELYLYSDNHVYMVESDAGSVEWDARMNNNGASYNDAGLWGSLSDDRAKEYIDTPSYVADVLRLPVRKYRLVKSFRRSRDDDMNPVMEIVDRTRPIDALGFSAQEVEQIIPGLVDTDEWGIKSLKSTVLIPMLVQTVQSLNQRISELEAALSPR